MQQMTWQDGKLRPVTGKAFLSRILLAHLGGVTPAEFAEQELRRAQCKWCADGFLLFDGVHNVFGLPIPCDATKEAVKISQAQRYLDTLGRIK